MHHRNGWIPKQLPCWNTVHQTHSLGNRSTTNICTTSTDWLLHNETLTSRKRNRRRPTINLQQGKYTLHCCHRNGNKTKTNCALLPSQRKQNKDKLCWLSDPAVATNPWPHRMSNNHQVMVETSLVPSVPSLEETQFRPLLLCLKDETSP